MQYTQVIFKITNDQDFVKDILIQQLAEIDFDSFAEQDNEEMIAYIQTDLFSEQRLYALLKDFDFEGINIIKIEQCEDIDWNHEWEKNSFQPIEVGTDCIIRAPFHTISKDYNRQIIINPKMAFGTGSHQTTYLILSTLLELRLTDKSVLDMGCGTGVLAILSRKLGATPVTAIDIDDWCTENAKENCELNNIDDIEIQQGNASLLQGREFDIIIANINRNILLMDMPQYKQSLKADGRLIISGFYTKDIPILTEKAQSLGLKKIGEKSKDNWAMLMFG